jgi:hypothetical protein
MTGFFSRDAAKPLMAYINPSLPARLSMKEADLRKYHRSIGITIAVFVFFQAFTGLLLSVEHIFSHINQLEFAHLIHFGGGLAGNIYRIVLALGLLFMAGTGSWIYFKIRSRTLLAAQKMPPQSGAPDKS